MSGRSAEVRLGSRQTTSFKVWKERECCVLQIVRSVDRQSVPTETSIVSAYHPCNESATFGLGAYRRRDATPGRS